MRITRLCALALLAVAVAAAGGCGRSISVSVVASADPDVDLTQLHRIAVSTETDVAGRRAAIAKQVTQAVGDDLVANQGQPVDPQPQPLAFSDDPALLDELAHVARNQLTVRGWTTDPADPQLLLTIDDCSGSYAYTLPQRTVDVPLEAAPEPITITPSGGIQTRPMSSSGGAGGGGVIDERRSALLPVRAIMLTIYDPRKPDHPLWQASAVSLHSAESMRTLAPYLIRAMLEEFPSPSGKPIQRSIPLESAANH